MLMDFHLYMFFYVASYICFTYTRTYKIATALCDNGNDVSQYNKLQLYHYDRNFLLNTVPLIYNFTFTRVYMQGDTTQVL